MFFFKFCLIHLTDFSYCLILKYSKDFSSYVRAHQPDFKHTIFDLMTPYPFSYHTTNATALLCFRSNFTGSICLFNFWSVWNLMKHMIQIAYPNSCLILLLQFCNIYWSVSITIAYVLCVCSNLPKTFFL